MLGNGDGTFRPQVTYPVGQIVRHPDAMVAGDFSGNGILDLAVANQRGQRLVLMGNGDGTFQPDVTYPTSGARPVGIAAGDFTGDGRLDLAVADGSSTTRRDPDGQRRRDVPARSTSSWPAVNSGGDRGGGLQRRRQARPGRRECQRIAQRPSRSCSATGRAISRPPPLTQIGERRGDGRGRLHRRRPARPGHLVRNSGSPSCSGNGDGTFVPGETFFLPGNVTALVTGDFNGDGRLDLAAVDSVGR